MIFLQQLSFLCYKKADSRLCIVLTATVHHCNETLKAACAAILSLKSQQDAERTEHRRYNNKARDEVMRLQRLVEKTEQQLKLEIQKVTLVALIAENCLCITGYQ